MGKSYNDEYLENGWSYSEADENLELLVVLGTAYVGYFSCLIQFGVIWYTLQSIDVKIFKRLLLPQFSYNFNQTVLKI